MAGLGDAGLAHVPGRNCELGQVPPPRPPHASCDTGGHMGRGGMSGSGGPLDTREALWDLQGGGTAGGQEPCGCHTGVWCQTGARTRVLRSLVVLAPWHRGRSRPCFVGGSCGVSSRQVGIMSGCIRVPGHKAAFCLRGPAGLNLFGVSGGRGRESGACLTVLPPGPALCSWPPWAHALSHASAATRLSRSTAAPPPPPT